MENPGYVPGAGLFGYETGNVVELTDDYSGFSARISSSVVPSASAM